MKVNVVTKEVEIHVTPLENIKLDGDKVIIEFDDVKEDRWRLTFSPYQGFEVTSIDCFSAKKLHTDESYLNGIYHRYLLEIHNSTWIKRLKENLIDKSATFMDNAHHYALPFQDIVVEVVAWDNYKLEKI